MLNVAANIIELSEALDKWMSKGGRMPNEWMFIRKDDISVQREKEIRADAWNEGRRAVEVNPSSRNPYL